MFGAGVFMVILGAASFVLPMMNLQLKILSVIPESARPIVGGGLIAVGAVLAFLGRKGAKKEEKK